jgi:multiple sugar transport system substrate-binding protein
MKKISLLLMISLVVLFLLVSCSTGTTSTGTTAGAKTASGSEEKGAKEQVVLNFLIADIPDSRIAESNIDSFYAKNPNIKVNFTFLSQKEISDKTRLELSAGSPTYDVLYFDDQVSGTYVSAGWLADVTSYVERDAAEINIEDFTKASINACKFGDTYYGLPQYQEGVWFMFRADLFEKYDVKPPTTLDEWTDAAKKLTLKDENGKQLYGTVLTGFPGPGAITYTYTPILKAFGSYWFDDDFKPIFNNEGGKAAAEWYKMMSDYCPPGITNFKWNECLTAFQQGEVATLCDATVFKQQIEDPSQSIVTGKVGYLPMPTGPEGAFPSSYIGMWGINSNSLHIEEAWQLVKWLSSPEQDVQLSGPARVSSSNDPKVLKGNEVGVEGYEAPQALTKTFEIASSPFPRIPEWLEVSSIVSNALDAILLGDDVTTTLDKAAKDVESLMEKAGYYK